MAKRMTQGSIITESTPSSTERPKMRVRFDVIILSGLLLLCNLKLLKGGFSSSLVFSSLAWKDGQWWRLITHPFVHVSLYHFFLDGAAFFLLYLGLQNDGPYRRALSVMFCGAGSLIMALIMSPSVCRQGLCGLSGIAHGLMAVSALELMYRRENYGAGLVTLLLVAGKSIYEVMIGDVLFSFMHMGLCGSPVASCHAGGVLGGIGIFFLLYGKPVRPPSPQPSALRNEGEGLSISIPPSVFSPQGRGRKIGSALKGAKGFLPEGPKR